MKKKKKKSKAEKRKAKKKRRKERKKQQKSEEENTAEKQNGQSPAGIKAKENYKSSASEEDIDTSSAFVAVIAKKQQIPVLEAKHKTENINSYLSASKSNEDRTSIVLRSRQLALRGNEMANLGHYSEAADLFSESIKLDPSDHRFYGNRSYCFERLGQHERALKDAEKAITLCPVWPKGYFRKGRALLGVKKYALAEECFVKVLKLDNDCEAAISELHKVKILQIMEVGFSKEQAETALSQHASVKECIQSLLAGGAAQMKIADEIDVFISDDESDGFWTCVAKSKQSPHDYDVKMDPKNPEGHNSLWVGNVQPDVTEKKLTTLFSKCGELLSIKVMPEKFCAFVNYKSKSAPGKAMLTYQGYELHGAKLVIRYPNLPGEAVKKKERATGPVNGTECYFWRTTGCIYGEHCHNLHIKEHKGIDKKNWHVT